MLLENRLRSRKLVWLVAWAVDAVELRKMAEDWSELLLENVIWATPDWLDWLNWLDWLDSIADVGIEVVGFEDKELEAVCSVADGYDDG